MAAPYKLNPPSEPSLSDDSNTIAMDPRSECEPIDPDYARYLLQTCLENIPFGKSVLYVTQDEFYTDQLPPRKVGGPLSELQEPTNSVIVEITEKTLMSIGHQTKVNW